MFRAIKYRAYPTEEQITMFKKTFGCCRKVWNLMLADKKNSYKETGKFIATTPAQYKSDYEFLNEVDSSALANVQINLQTAFSNHFSKKRKKKCGFPKFKSKKPKKNKSVKKSYTSNNINGNIRIIDNNSIKLPKIKDPVKIKMHRLPESNWLLKSVTVSQESDGTFYISVLFDIPDVTESYDYDIDFDNAIGLDYKSDGLYVDDQNNRPEVHKYFRESQKKLAKEQRRLARMKGSKKNEPKSKNFFKQLKKVNKIHRHIANQRKDQLHKLSTEIANRYDIVCVEDLDMTAIGNKGFGNGKATMDNGYGMFVRFLEYKLFERQKYLVKVDKWFPSSQLCFCCGKKHPEMKDLKIRVMLCECGNNSDRDHNSAKNIKKEGIRILMEILSA